MKRIFNSQSAFLNVRVLVAFAICLTGVSLALIGFAANSLDNKNPSQTDASARPEVIAMQGPVSLDVDLRMLPYVAQEGETEEVPLMRHPRVPSATPEKFDPLKPMRTPAEPQVMPTPIATFPGINSAQSACGCLPPDTNGDVGPNHYIQTVNSRFKIINKSGTELVAPTTFNSFFAALGGSTPCGTSNRGDPVTFYDHLADRWVISDFAFNSFPGSSFYQCIGVSKTSDPVAGGWWLYSLQVDPANPTYLGDYPKFGLWPDAYYMTVNMFSNNTTFTGVRVYALPRTAMINGTGAPNPGAIAFSITPANLGDSYSLVAAGFRTGNPPAAGTPEYFLAIDSPATGGVILNQVHVWRFHVDFQTPANSTFGVGPNHTADANITVDSFTDAFTDSGFSIVPQGGTTRLIDTLGDKIMYPVVYHSRNGTESLWAAHTINNNQNGTGPTAVRWYQFNVTGSTIPSAPTQSQTWNNAADGLWRFQPSIAVDARGNMAIAYSTSSSSIFPSIRYAGRLASDPLNSLAQGEAVMQAGGGSQTGSSRWGDYSMLAIDPSDQATFWHTHEYYSSTSGSSWNTRIGEFKFPAAPLQFLGGVSRKTHGGAGNFDIALPGIESRTGGVAGDYTLVFTFSNNVTSGSLVINSGTGTVSGSPIFSANTMTVNLTGVTNVQTLSFTLHSVTDEFSQVLPDTAGSVAFMIGDTNANGVVNASDVAQTKSETGQPVTGSNFRTDVNRNGAINGSDAALVKSHTGGS